MCKFNIYKRKDGRFEGRIYSTSDQKRIYRSFYGKTTEEVKQKMSAFFPDQTVTDMTVRQVIDEWRIFIMNRIKPSTAANYQMKLNKHILPFFSDIRCADINDSVMYRFIKKKESENLSLRYISDMIVIIRSAFRYAARTLRIFNPLDGFVFHRPGRNEVKILTKNEQKKLIRRFKNPSVTDVGIALSLYTGMRIGEVCGLKCEDIDLKNRTIVVKRTVQRIQQFNKERKTMLIVTEPKSASSRRTIPIPDGLMPLLSEFYGSGKQYILSGSDKPVEPRTMQNRFSAILKKERLPSVHFHSLRHAFATRAVEVGFDIKTLSEILGHSNVELTLNLYVHSSLERKRACMDFMTV